MVTERRRCACRGVIESETDPESIEIAVQTHRRQPEHRDYAALEQLRGNYVARQSVQLPTLRLLR